MKRFFLSVTGPLFVSLLPPFPPSFLRAQAGPGLSFRKVQEISKLPPASILRLADVDGDGDLDLFWGTYTRTWDLLFLNDGKGRFKKANPARLQSLVDRTFQVEFMDLDGDGDLDLFKGTDRGLHLLFNDGKGRFREKKKVFPPMKGYRPFFGLGDLDGDKDPDLLFPTRTKEKVGRLHVDELLCRLNDGKGRFSAPVPLDRTIGYTCRPLLLDMNKDGRVDILEIPCGVDTYLKERPPLGILLNKGGMKFEKDRARGIPKGSSFFYFNFGYYRGGIHGSILPIGDVDGDGLPDLLLDFPFVRNPSGWPARSHLFRNLDGKRFEEDKELQEALARFFRKAGINDKWWPSFFLLFDLDGDGDLDIAPLYTYWEKNRRFWKSCFLQNQGRAHFRVLPLEMDFPGWHYGGIPLVAGDLNEDGAPDLVLAPCKWKKNGYKPLPKGGSLRIFLQERKPAATTGKSPTTPGGSKSGKKKKSLSVQPPEARGFAPHEKTGGEGEKNGTPGGARTLDLRFRKPTLYPAELRAHPVGGRG